MPPLSIFTPSRLGGGREGEGREGEGREGEGGGEGEEGGERNWPPEAEAPKAPSLATVLWGLQII